MKNKYLLMIGIGLTMVSLASLVYMKLKDDEIVNEGFDVGEDGDRTVVATFYGGSRQKTVEISKPVESVEFVNKYRSLARDYVEERDDMKREPYVISFENFCEGNESQEKITLTYYAKDSVLIDETDEGVVEDIPTVIGDALNRFGELSEDSDVVYVRNERLGIDYEVVRVADHRRDIGGDLLC